MFAVAGESNPAGQLLDPDDYEFGRLQRREADQDIDHAVVDILLRSGCRIANDSKCLARL